MRPSLPSPPLLFIAFFTLHRSPLSERLEQAMSLFEGRPFMGRLICVVRVVEPERRLCIYHLFASITIIDNSCN